MIRQSANRLLAAFAVLLCVAGLAACGSSTPSTSSSATTSPPPGSGDTAICQIVSKATAAYNSKDYATWRTYMSQIASSADSAQYLPLKRYAEEVKQAESQASTTTTTKARTRQPKGGSVGVGVSGLFAALGSYIQLQHVCAHLPSS
jgi:hypothetical protein